MTKEQAKTLLAREREAIHRAQCDLQTCHALFAIGEDDKALNLFASVRRNLRKQITESRD